YAVGVSSALKGRAQKPVNDRQGQLDINMPGRNAYDVGVVMLPCYGRKFFLPTDRRTDTLVLICRHGYAVRRAANQDTEVGIAVFDRGGNGMREIGIVYRICTVRAYVVYRVSGCFKVLYNLGFVTKTSVVATDSYFFYLSHGQ